MSSHSRLAIESIPQPGNENDDTFVAGTDHMTGSANVRATANGYEMERWSFL
jgi:hypothetical protein